MLVDTGTTTFILAISATPPYLLRFSSKTNTGIQGNALAKIRSIPVYRMTASLPSVWSPYS